MTVKVGAANTQRSIRSKIKRFTVKEIKKA